MSRRARAGWIGGGIALAALLALLAWPESRRRIASAVSGDAADDGGGDWGLGGSSGTRSDGGTAGQAGGPVPADAGLVGELGPWLPTATVTDDPGSPFGTLAGRVVSRADGSPVAGAELVFERDGATVDARSGPDGRFALVASAEGRHVLAIASAEGFLPFAPEWGHSPIAFVARPGQRIDGVTIQLRPEEEVRVEVVDAAGAPAAGAEVRLIGAGAAERSLAPVRDLYRTDADGVATVRAWRWALLEARREGEVGRGRVREGRARITLAASDAPLADGRIGGTVVGPDGAPIEGAVVRAFVPRRGQHGEGQAVSDEAGRFALDGLDDAEHVLIATHPAHPRTRVFGVAVGRDDVEVRMPAGLSIEGRVVDASGAPLPAFTVVAQRARGSLRRRTVASVSSYDPQGHFLITGLEEDAEHVLVATARGYPPSAPVEASPGQTARLVIERGGRVEGTVRGEDGAPIAGAQVRLSGYLGRGPSVSPLSAQTVSGPDGTFALDGVGSEPRSVRVSADGHHDRLVSGFSVRAGETRVVDVVMSPTAEGESPRTELAGIGAILLPGEDELVVRRVVAGGAAMDAGLAAGDRILAIDGAPVTALGFGGSLERIRGEEGTVVRLRVRRGDEAPRELAITRRRVRT